MKDYYMKTEIIDATISLSGNGKTIIHEGSRIVPAENVNEDYALYSDSFAERIRLEKEGVIKDNLFVKKHTFNNLSIATKLVLGHECIPELEWKDENGNTIYEIKDKKELEKRKRLKEKKMSDFTVDTSLFFDDESETVDPVNCYYLKENSKRNGFYAIGYFKNKDFYLGEGSQMCKYISGALSPEVRNLRSVIYANYGKDFFTTEKIQAPNPAVAIAAITGNQNSKYKWADSNGNSVTF